MQFVDRKTAGQALVSEVGGSDKDRCVIVALPKGGVILGFELAKSLDVPLGMILVHKIGHPAYTAYAIAAIAEGEDLVYSETEIMPVDELWLAAAEKKTRHIIARQRALFFTQQFTQPQISGNTAILVDDGMATGLTMQAAIHAVRHMHAGKIVVAVPVASNESVELIEPLVDNLIVLDKPRNFLGVIASHYLRFPRINDLTVRQLLERSNMYGLRHTTATHS